MKTSVLSVTILGLLVAAAHAQGPGAAVTGQTAIARAATAGKFAYVFVWKERNAQTDRAWADLQAGTKNLTPWAETVAVHVTDPAEHEFVSRYDLTRAPMPLVLAMAPCGAITKAYPKATGLGEDQLRLALVSPCTQLSLKALQDQKLVLLCVMDQQDARNPAMVPPGVRDFKADGRFGPATEIVLVNAQDEREATFLKELQVDARAPKPLTVLMAPPGSVLGTFDARATKEQFVAQLVAAQSNPCADGKCGPDGCGPRK